MSITIAIDGYAGCGKSSTAKAVARELDYLYIDTGAMYRSVALYLMRQHVNFEEDDEALQAALTRIHLGFVREGNGAVPVIHLNGESVEKDIRQPNVSAVVSQVSVHASVRDMLVAQQRRIGADGGVVMDGRDIGTVVFPQAELKIFMTAEMETRARRRLAELVARGVDSDLEAVIHNLRERDHIDTTRPIAPLRQAEDAVVVDTTHLSFDQQVRHVVNLARERIQELRPS